MKEERFAGKQNSAGEMGHRIAKHSYDKDQAYNNGLGQLVKSTYYVLDAQGNTMATYERAVDENTLQISYAQTEKFIYGSSRLGVQNVNIGLLGSQNNTYTQTTVPHRIGKKGYELSNHLGNVLSIISDKVIPHSNGATVDYWLADINQSTDFSAFHAPLIGRTLYKSNNTLDYRYGGSNGQEKTDEIAGNGNHYTAEYWEYDTRLGRRWNLDPVVKPWLSIYHVFSLNPVSRKDILGSNDSPIYDTEGNLMGTDDQGLTGTAVIMKKEDFKQGMKHEDALKSNLSYNGLKDDIAKNKFYKSYKNLPTRPDYDGYLTLSEANYWYKNGQGKPLFTSLKKIDLSSVYSLGESFVGDIEVINLFLYSNSINDALVYGNITLKRYPDHQVRAYADFYNFEMHSSINPLNWSRNLLTIIGEQYAGQGKKFEINLYGSKTLTPILPWLK
jgi:hypothetical protein